MFSFQRFVEPTKSGWIVGQPVPEPVRTCMVLHHSVLLVVWRVASVNVDTFATRIRENVSLKKNVQVVPFPSVQTMLTFSLTLGLGGAYRIKSKY